jgi:hypothetical protein
MPAKCEACEEAIVTVEEPNGEGKPFRVCLACHSRLLGLALRPVEWFNLAKRHGVGAFLLHDDFYADNGTAYQAQREVDSPEQHPAPTLSTVCDDPDALLDFTITQGQFTAEVALAWQALDHTAVLMAIKRRYRSTDLVELQAVVLEIAACSLGERGRDFVLAALKNFSDPCLLGPLAQASVTCLTFDDGFGRVVDALSRMDENSRRDSMYALFYFHTDGTLDWIESNVSSPVSEDWGRLAAASLFTWKRAVSWLNKGRLVSLVALDALEAIVRPQSLLLREYGPELVDKPSRAVFEEALKEYVHRDSVPRVKKTVEFLLENSSDLTQG